MLRAQDVSTDMVRCSTDQLGLIGEPVGLDLRGCGVSFSIFFTKNHVCRAKPSNLVQGSLSSVTPKLYSFSQLKNSILALVLATECTSQLGIGIS